MEISISNETKNTNTNYNHEYSDSDVINELNILKLQYEDLRKKFDVIEQEFKIQNSLYMSAISDSSFIAMLNKATDYNSWFKLLPECCKRFLVVLSVKDTPGDYMPDFVYKSVIESGFTNLRKDLWNTYVGVIYKTSILCNERHANDEKTSYIYETLDHKFKLAAYSEPWRNGNRGDISINGEQLSTNIRGLNIVIYDLNNNNLIDSIGFDSHDANSLIFIRR